MPIKNLLSRHIIIKAATGLSAKIAILTSTSNWPYFTAPAGILPQHLHLILRHPDARFTGAQISQQLKQLRVHFPLSQSGAIWQFRMSGLPTAARRVFHPMFVCLSRKIIMCHWPATNSWFSARGCWGTRACTPAAARGVKPNNSRRQN